MNENTKNTLNKLVQQLGFPEYKVLTGSSIFTVDIEHKLFHYEDVENKKIFVARLDNIVYCESEPDIKIWLWKQVLLMDFYPV